MKRPYKYIIIDNKTGDIEETDIEPMMYQLQTHEPTNDPNRFVLQQTKTAYIDTRYDAKLRLYNYITYTKQGKEIPNYRPYDGTKIGKSLPILNF